VSDSTGAKTGYTMRVEGGEYDSPNIHVFDKRGHEVGRFSLKPEEVGWTNAERLPARVQELVKEFAATKWGAENVATGVPGRAYAESYYARQQARQVEAEEEIEGGKGGGGRAGSRVIAALVVVDLGLNLYSQYYTNQHFGYYYDLFGQLNVTNLALAAANLPRGTAIEYNGIRFINTGKSWMNPTCGSKLTQDKNGNPVITGGC
jgi:hypothetical protein